MYTAALEGDRIKTSIIADNCYKSLTPAEYKWVIREVDVRKKKNEIDVYMIPDQPGHCKQVLTLLLRWLFCYGYTTNGNIDEYIADTHKLIDQLDIHSMKILTAIPETCIFTFPTDQESRYIHEISLDIVKHCVDYNQNWEMDAAYMYWFWNHLQGEGYAPTVDQENNPREVPKSAPQPNNYFNNVFKPKLKKISTIMANKLIGSNGILFNETAASILAPWTYEFFKDNPLNDFGSRNTELKDILNQCDGIISVRRFIEWVHDTVISYIPKHIWKSFNAISGSVPIQDTPILFLPNNFTLFDPEYELETGLLTGLNSLYWTYGYISETDGVSVTKKPTINAYRSFLYQGSLCYDLGENPVKFNNNMYESFVLQWNPSYTSTYVRQTEPKVDTEMIAINNQYLFRWKTGKLSYLTQGIGADIRPVGMDDMIPHIGARCPMLPYKEYILAELLPLYLKASGCPYGKANKNQWLVTFADHIIGRGIDGVNTLMTVLFNGTVKRLLRCQITFPYNNILNMNFINAAHFNWFGEDLPTDAKSKNWNSVMLPQYIFTKSLNETAFSKTKEKMVDSFNPIKLEEPKTDEPIKITLYECTNDDNVGMIPCDWT
jgi:hypothetical protein